MIDGLFGGWAHFIVTKKKTRKEKLHVMGFHSCTLVMQLVVFCRSSGSEES